MAKLPSTSFPNAGAFVSMKVGFLGNFGTPTGNGVIQDAIAVANCAIEVDKVLPSRILLFGRSLVNNSQACRCRALRRACPRGGHVDAATLIGTYIIAGVIPAIGTIAYIPSLFNS